jgi:hypothetical protein
MSERPRPPVNAVPAAADKPEAAMKATRPPVLSDPAKKAEPKPLPPLLQDPIPRVTAILVSPDRKLASVGDEGQIIGIGDVLGRRVVVAIDERAVVLKEPSGVQIRVGLGGRVIGIERSERQ